MADTDFDTDFDESFSSFEDSDEESNEEEENDTTLDEDSDEETDEDEDEDSDKEDEEEDEEEDDDEKKKPKKQNRLGKRFHKITEEKRLLREKISRYEERFGKFDENDLPPKPNPRQYQDERSYRDACVEWTANAKHITETKEITQKNKLASEQQKFKQKLLADKSKYKDFEEVMESFVETMGSEPLTAELHDAFCNDPNGTDLLYYFGKNPEILLDIYSMTPSKSAMTLGKISERLSIINKKKLGKKAVSKAPTPIKGKKSSSRKKVNLDKCSMEEYVKARKKQNK